MCMHDVIWCWGLTCNELNRSECFALEERYSLLIFESYWFTENLLAIEIIIVQFQMNVSRKFKVVVNKDAVKIKISKAFIQSLLDIILMRCPWWIWEDYKVAWLCKHCLGKFSKTTYCTSPTGTCLHQITNEIILFPTLIHQQVTRILVHIQKKVIILI